MPLSDNGKVFLAEVVIGISSTLFNNANAMIGVGDSDVPFISSQEDLQGINKVRIGMDEGFPKVDTEDPSILIFRSTC